MREMPAKRAHIPRLPEKSEREKRKLKRNLIIAK